jgi:hypothetical protein
MALVQSQQSTDKETPHKQRGFLLCALRNEMVPGTGSNLKACPKGEHGKGVIYTQSKIDSTSCFSSLSARNCS